LTASAASAAEHWSFQLSGEVEAMNVFSSARSVELGRTSEVAVLSPIRRGRIPGERRTYEERVRFSIDSIARRVSLGRPTFLSSVTTIHFARMTVIRPEQLQRVSRTLRDATGEPPARSADDVVETREDGTDASENGEAQGTARQDFEMAAAAPPQQSHLLTQVIFSGDLKTYFRDVADFLADDFDSVFINCEEFVSTSNFEGFWAWIQKFSITTDLFYAAYPDIDVPRVRELEDFKRRFDALVERARPGDGSPPVPLDTLFDDFLKETQQRPDGFPSPGGLFPRNDGRGRS